MKTAKAQSTTATSHLQAKREGQPFFQKGARDNLANKQTPFFSGKSAIQTKLTVGQPGDKYEQEADQMADTVVQRLGESDAPAVQKKQATVTSTPTLQKQSAEETTDREGNEIAMSWAGKWYLVAEPQNMQFSAASGYRHELFPINPNHSYSVLREHCTKVMGEQLEIAESLNGDMKYWFAKVYYYVSKFELEKIDAGEYQYPHMKMQEVIHFYNTYKFNIYNWEKGNKSLVEDNWKRAFSAAESMNDGIWWRTTSLEIMKALLPSMEAHIRFDLPRAIASVYNLHYSGILLDGMKEFKIDFFEMHEVFDKANEALTNEINDEEGRGRLIDPTSWDWLQEAGFPFVFNVGLERELAWEKAEFLYEYRYLNPARADQYIRDNLGTPHPFFEPFDVNGAEVSNYDWYNEPVVNEDFGAQALPYGTDIYKYVRIIKEILGEFHVSGDEEERIVKIFEAMPPAGRLKIYQAIEGHEWNGNFVDGYYLEPDDDLWNAIDDDDRLRRLRDTINAGVNSR